jgi:hypothetical protein
MWRFLLMVRIPMLGSRKIAIQGRTMNRRRFLSSTMLGSAAAVGLAGSAHAFTIQSCNATAKGESACGEFQQHIQFHKKLLADLKREFDRLHLSPAQQQAVLAQAICPICGQPLIG